MKLNRLVAQLFYLLNEKIFSSLEHCAQGAPRGELAKITGI